MRTSGRFNMAAASSQRGGAGRTWRARHGAVQSVTRTAAPPDQELTRGAGRVRREKASTSVRRTLEG